MRGVGYLLFLIGAELGPVAVPGSFQAGLEVADASRARDLLVLAVVEPGGVALADAVQAILEISIAAGARHLLLLFGIQLALIAVDESVETIHEIVVLHDALYGLAFLRVQCCLITDRELIQTVLKVLCVRGLRGLCRHTQRRAASEQQGEEDPSNEFHERPPRCLGHRPISEHEMARQRNDVVPVCDGSESP